MRILFILEYYHPHIGGVETLFKSLVEKLAEGNHTITVLTNRYRSDLLSLEKSENITIKRLAFFNRYLFSLLAFFPALRLALQHDLIHTTSYNAGIPAYFAGLFSRKKVIITFHEAWGKLWFTLPFFSKISLYFHYLFEKFLLKLPFHRFIAVSEATKQNLILSGIRESKIIRIYNGIEYPFFQDFRKDPARKSDSKFIFIYFGRLGISKGLDLLLASINKLKQSNNKFHVQIVIPTTPESLYTKVMNLVKELDIENYIEFYHDLERGDLFNKVRLADAVVIPSYSEGFCFTAVETMAIGTPIICSEGGALKEVISGKHLYFRPFDSDSLKEAMTSGMLKKWDFKEEKIFPLQKTVEEYLKLYKSLI